MSFFNKKEEVMEVQLTQYGRFMLSKGKFKPVYYSFSDDDVIYDISYAENKVETGKESHERIQKDTIRTRPLIDAEGAETRVKRLYEQVIGYGDTRLLNRLRGDDLYRSQIGAFTMVPDSRKIIRNIIGSSQTGNKFMPSWSVSSLNEERFETPIQISSSGPDIGMRRPQINMIVDHELEASPIAIGQMPSMEEYLSQTGLEDFISFIDGYAVDIKDGKISLDFLEKNTDFAESGFDLEFFLVEQEDQEDPPGGGTAGGNDIIEERLVPLSLIPSPGRDVNLVLTTYFEVSVDGDFYQERQEITTDVGTKYGSDTDDDGWCD